MRRLVLWWCGRHGYALIESRACRRVFYDAIGKRIIWALVGEAHGVWIVSGVGLENEEA